MVDGLTGKACMLQDDEERISGTRHHCVRFSGGHPRVELLVDTPGGNQETAGV
jgi:hypothetical protein